MVELSKSITSRLQVDFVIELAGTGRVISSGANQAFEDSGSPIIFWVDFLCGVWACTHFGGHGGGGRSRRRWNY